MRYRITLWNIICGLLLLYDIYLFNKPAPSIDERFAAAYIIPVIIAGVIIDFVLQHLLESSKWLFIAQLLLFITIIIINKLP